MAPSKGDPAEGEDEESASVGRRARSGGICPTRRHADDEARSAARTPAGEGGSRAVERRVVPGETRGKGAAADVVQEALPTCGCHIERYRHHDHHAVPRRRRPVRVGDGEGTSAAGAEEAVRTCGSYTDTPPRSPTPPPVSASTALGIKGGRGGRGPKNKRVEVSRGGVPMDGFEESVARCGFRNPRLVRRCPTQPGRDTTRGAQTGTAASCISVAAATGARGGGGGRGHDDYAGTSRPRAAQLHAPTMDLPAEIYDTGDIEGPSGSFTVNNVQGKFAGYVLHTGSSLEGPDSKALSVGDEVKCKEVIGDRIDQKGSIVLPEKLRFDFSHGTHFSSTRDAAEEDIAKGVQRITAVTAECAKQAVKLASSIETDINETSNLDGATLEKNADKTGLPTIGEEVKQLAQRVRDNSLKPQDYEAFSDFPDFVCSDKGGYAGSNNGKCNYISKMNFYLRDGSMSDDMMLVSDGEESSNYSLRFEELKDFKNFSNNAKEITHLRRKIDSDYYTEHKGYFCALYGSCKNMKKRRDETQLFVDLCGSSISLQKDLNTSNVNMLMEAACARAGLKSNDCYSTFSGKVLEPERLLSYYQIKRDCTIRVNRRIRGGKLLTIDFETWDDKMKDCPRDQTVELHRDLIGPDNERMGVNTVTYLSESLQFLAKQVLIGLCRNHFIGISFGGNFTSEHLLFDRGNFKFDDCVPIDKYSRRSALKDYHRIYEIFDKAFRAGNKPYPMHSGHLINFLARTPPLADPQSEATIAYLTNHYSLLSHSQRIKMSEVLDSLREMLDGNDFLNFKFAIGKINWTERIEEITAMSEVYFYHAKWNKFGTLIYIPYVNNDNASLLRFSDNFFKHARYPIQQLEAAFSLAMEKENFMPQLLFDCMIKFQNVVELAGPMGVKYCCSVDVEEFIQEVISMLGKNTLCCKRSDEASTS